MFSSGILKELSAVEGRYIEWEWDPQTFRDNYISMREANGYQAVRPDTRGGEANVTVSRNAIDELVNENCIREDQSKRASGLRTYRLTDEGRRLGALRNQNER